MSKNKLTQLDSKRKNIKLNNIKLLPTTEIECGSQFCGYFTGLSVDVIGEQSAKFILNEHGCFGIGSDTILHLFMEEAFFLHHSLKCLRIMDLDSRELTTEDILNRFCSVKTDFIIKYVSYVFLRSKNWIVKSGLKFGGDFRKCIAFFQMYLFIFESSFTVLYKVGPRFYHAKFVVLVRDASKPEHTHTHCIQGHNRISESSKKVYISTYNL